MSSSSAFENLSPFVEAEEGFVIQSSTAFVFQTDPIIFQDASS